LKHKAPAKVHARLVGYISVMAILVACLLYGVMTVSSVELEVDRGRGANLFRENYRGDIINSYNLRVMNKTQEARSYQIAVNGIEGISVDGATILELAPGEISQLPLSVTAPLGDIESRVTPIEFSVWDQSNPEQRDVVESRFMAPVRSRVQ
jgi:polyferredoxin